MTIVDATVDEAPPHRRATRSVRDLPAAERPRERLAMRGPGGLSAAELISVILGTGGGGRSAMEVAEDLVARHDGVRALSRASDVELAATPGLGGAKAARLAAAFELGRRSVAEWPTGRWTIRSPRAGGAPHQNSAMASGRSPRSNAHASSFGATQSPAPAGGSAGAYKSRSPRISPLALATRYVS